MILVTGATGTVGAEVVDLLTRRGVARRLMARNVAIASARHPESEVVAGAFEDPRSLDAALRGVDVAFLATAPGPSVASHDEAMIAAAKRAGVRKLVKLSGAGGVTAKGVGSAGIWHQPGERALQASGVAFTLLRPSAFASNARRYIPAIKQRRPVAISTGKGREGVVDPRDIAEVAVAALLSPTHDGKTYTLTGPEALTAGQQVAILGAVLGRELPVVDVSLEETVRQMREAGTPPAYLEATSEGLREIREGRAAVCTDDVQRILGRPPRAFATWAEENAALFA